jgi:guanylate kinase
MREGLLIVISGPSGTGKSTICQASLECFPHMGFSVSATTRPPRPGEREGEHYFFLSEEEFQRRLVQGKFLEWACVYGNYYGTLRSVVEDMLAAGQDVLFDIDIQGGRQVRAQIPNGVFIFLVPPSCAEQRRRLAARNTDCAETIEQRIRETCLQMEALPEYDYWVINDNLEQTVATVQAIITAEKQRVDRQKEADLVKIMRLEVDDL